MSKFKFRLATLLRLREAFRDERQVALTDAYHADDVLRQRQEELAAQIAALKGAHRQAVGPGHVNVDSLLDTHRYELTLRAATAQIVQRREQVAVEIERRREALVQANRDVRVLEKLREHQTSRHREEEAQRELKLLDEVASRIPVGEDDP
jgi:flagellar export protein FliJ